MAFKELRDKVPPHNLEAEQATLGAILLDPEAISLVIPILRPEDFYRTSHQYIFQSILDLSERNEAIDLITLKDNLTAQSLLDSVGGVATISHLTSVVPTTANVEFYARIVRETSIRRRLLHISHELISSSQDESKETRQVVEEAERKIFEITDNAETKGFKRAKDIVGNTIEIIEKTYHSRENYTGVPSGFSQLDNMLSGFQDSEFIVIGARPSMGKTALALSMAGNIAIHQKVPTGFFTLEMSDQALMQRLVSMESRVSSQALRTGMLRHADFQSLTDAAGLIYEAPLLISDTPNMKLLDLRAQARRMKSQYDIKILFIDYLTLVGAENTDIPRHEQIAEISRSLKSLARELAIPIVALSQVSRDTEGKVPTLANLRESGSIEQDADVVIFIHRDRGHDRETAETLSIVETQLVVAKQRNGPVGTIQIAFLPQYTKFESLAQDVN